MPKTLFYRVKPEYDQHPVLASGSSDWVLLAGELYTYKQIEGHGISSNKRIWPCAFEQVELDIEDTYTCFGARRELS